MFRNNLVAMYTWKFQVSCLSSNADWLVYLILPDEIWCDVVRFSSHLTTFFLFWLLLTTATKYREGNFSHHMMLLTLRFLHYMQRIHIIYESPSFTSLWDSTFIPRTISSILMSFFSLLSADSSPFSPTSSFLSLTRRWKPEVAAIPMPMHTSMMFLWSSLGYFGISFLTYKIGRSPVKILFSFSLCLYRKYQKWIPKEKIWQSIWSS